MSVDESNVLEITLAYNTMVWLNSLEDNEIPEEVKERMRDLCMLLSHS